MVGNATKPAKAAPLKGKTPLNKGARLSDALHSPSHARGRPTLSHPRPPISCLAGVSTRSGTASPNISAPSKPRARRRRLPAPAEAHLRRLGGTRAVRQVQCKLAGINVLPVPKAGCFCLAAARETLKGTLAAVSPCGALIIHRAPPQAGILTLQAFAKSSKEDEDNRQCQSLADLKLGVLWMSASAVVFVIRRQVCPRES